MTFLEKLRLSRGWSKYKVAKELGIIPQRYGPRELRVRYRFDIAVLTDIRRIYGLSWEEFGLLLDEEGERVREESKSLKEG